MAEKLMLVLRALIYQADMKPGITAKATLERGLLLQVTRSPHTGTYKLECGRKKIYSSASEVTTVLANWPNKIDGEVVWHSLPFVLKEDVHWMWSIIQPVPQGVP